MSGQSPVKYTLYEANKFIVINNIKNPKIRWTKNYDSISGLYYIKWELKEKKIEEDNIIKITI